MRSACVQDEFVKGKVMKRFHEIYHEAHMMFGTESIKESQRELIATNRIPVSLLIGCKARHITNKSVNTDAGPMRSRNRDY